MHRKSSERFMVGIRTGGNLDGCGYQPIALLTPTAGQTCLVGAHFAPVADVYRTAYGDSVLVFGSETFPTRVTFATSKIGATIVGDGPLAFPGLNVNVTGGFFGPNFLFTARDSTATPEPAVYALAGLGLGLCALLASRWRGKCTAE
jgi:hypothetical protein